MGSDAARASSASLGPATPGGSSAPIVEETVRQHVEGAAELHAARTMLTRAGHVRSTDIGRFDHRIAAHFEGITLAAERGWALCEEALENPTAGSVFTAVVCAIESRQDHRLGRVVDFARNDVQLRKGMLSAFGWVEPDRLRGIAATTLASADPVARLVGLAACSMHRVDPGLVSGGWLRDASPIVRARALRTAGELGKQEMAAACTAAVEEADPDCGFWTAWSAVLLGNRGEALQVLTKIGLSLGPHRGRAFQLALQAVDRGTAHAVLQRIARDPARLRSLIEGSALAGDPAYVPWLIGQMANMDTARLAGEAFSLMTGADLALLNLERKPPENFESGPNDDPNDPNVDMDPDEGLPWPDQQKVQAWWNANSSRFQPGQRYFMGAPVTREHCIDVLKNGYQRQRILAAHYLCLLNPGTPLFNTSAPAWRQQKLLAQMS